MKKTLFMIAIGSFSVLSADPYGYGSCPGGNCPMNQNPSYQGQGYYQGNQPGYNQGQSYNQGQAYYQGNAPAANPQNYNQNRNPSMNAQPAPQQRPQQGNTQAWGQPQWQNDQSGWDSSNSQYASNSDKKFISDEEISKGIRNALAPGMLSSGYPTVTFEVYNGNVTLRGTVEKASDKAKVESSVRNVDGVKQINNQVMVQERATADNYSKVKKNEQAFSQDYAATDADRLVNSKIRDKLNGGWFSKGYETIVVRTSNGIVTISGTVDSFDDIKKIGDDVKKVEGVKSVNNQLTATKK